jgi:hypothetical protein
MEPKGLAMPMKYGTLAAELMKTEPRPVPSVEKLTALFAVLTVRAEPVPRVIESAAVAVRACPSVRSLNHTLIEKGG